MCDVIRKRVEDQVRNTGGAERAAGETGDPHGGETGGSSRKPSG